MTTFSYIFEMQYAREIPSTGAGASAAHTFQKDSLLFTCSTSTY